MIRPLLFSLVLCIASPALAGDFSNEITTANVLALMNEYRAEAGLGPLRAHARLDEAATDRMRHMEEEAYWDHTSPNGISPFVWLRVRAYDYQAAGENLASGFETARLLVSSWMESPGHRANILSTMYEECGIAIIDGSTKGPANGKSVVVLFARPRQAVIVSKR
jgi:uncharacterized protein YkwD